MGIAEPRSGLNRLRFLSKHHLLHSSETTVGVLYRSLLRQGGEPDTDDSLTCFGLDERPAPVHPLTFPSVPSGAHRTISATRLAARTFPGPCSSNATQSSAGGADERGVAGRAEGEVGLEEGLMVEKENKRWESGADDAGQPAFIGVLPFPKREARFARPGDDWRGESAAKILKTEPDIFENKKVSTTEMPRRLLHLLLLSSDPSSTELTWNGEESATA